MLRSLETPNDLDVVAWPSTVELLQVSRVSRDVESVQNVVYLVTILISIFPGLSNQILPLHCPI